MFKKTVYLHESLDKKKCEQQSIETCLNKMKALPTFKTPKIPFALRQSRQKND